MIRPPATIKILDGYYSYFENAQRNTICETSSGIVLDNSVSYDVNISNNVGGAKNINKKKKKLLSSPHLKIVQLKL